MDVKKSKKLKNFISIEYPGHVVNDDKMIESLGGIEELSKGFQDKQKLQLKFRQNLYAKPALSTEQQESTGLVMKVKVRKSKRHRDKKPEIISTELLGKIQNSVLLCSLNYFLFQEPSLQDISSQTLQVTSSYSFLVTPDDNQFHCLQITSFYQFKKMRKLAKPKTFMMTSFPKT